MEKTSKQQTQVVVNVGSYKLTVGLVDGVVRFRASSEVTGRIFEESFTDDTLPGDIKASFYECSIFFELIAECIHKHNVIALSDYGELKLELVYKLGRSEVKRAVQFQLKEVALDEVQRLAREVHRLEETVAKQQLQINELKSLVTSVKREPDMQGLALKNDAVDQLRNRQFEQTVHQLRAQIADLEKLVKSRQVSNLADVEERLDTFMGKALLEVNLDSPFAKEFSFSGRKILMREITRDWIPLFLSKCRMRGVQYFQLELNEFDGNKIFGLGVSQLTHRNTQVTHLRKGSIVLWLFNNQGVWSEKKVRNSGFIAKEGEIIRVIVDQIRWEIVWQRTFPTYHQIVNYAIPEQIRGLDFYPFIEVHKGFSGVVTMM